MIEIIEINNIDEVTVIEVANVTGGAGGSGGAPTGPAGGSLSGTYPNPTIAAGVVTNTELGSLAVGSAKIAADAVTNAKLANMANNTIKGCITAGDPVDLTAAQSATLVASGSGGGTVNFLRADGTWAAPPAPSGGSVAADALWDAKGDLAVATGPDVAVKLPVGANGTVLTADSVSSTGVKWAGGAEPTGTQTFAYSGGAQSFTVPTDVTTILVTLNGAQGGQGWYNGGISSPGGLGAKVTGSITVIPGESLQINVGGYPGTSGSTAHQGGFNGGGNGGFFNTNRLGGGGGGASDIRRGGTALANRVAAAGGGGGGGAHGSTLNVGGNGGLPGTNGVGAYPGFGATIAAGGAPGTVGNGTAGVSGVGGAGATTGDVYVGGGGGGGLFGGGGGGAIGSPNWEGSGGGGGSCLVPSSGVATPGANSGAGTITLQWGLKPSTIVPDTAWDNKGDIAVAVAADTATVLPVGSNAQVLTADSTTFTGLKWAAGFSAVSTTDTSTVDFSGAGTAASPLTAIVPASSITNTQLGPLAVGTAKIADDAVTNAKLANMANNTLKGCVTAGDPVDLTAAQSATLVASGSGGGTTNFLRADGTWNSPVASPAFTSFTEKYAGIYVPKRALDRWQQASKPWTTTLSAAINNSVTSLTVTSIDGIPPLTKFRIYVESEQMLVTAGSGTTTWTVTRGVNNTTPAAHAIGIPVYGEAIMRVVSVGDSTAESSIGGGGGTAGGGSGGDGWVARLSRVLSRISGVPLLSPQLGGGGFFGVWRNADANIGGGAGNSAIDWTCPSGAWTLQAAGTANDRAPWGWTVTANGATNILKFTPPAYLGNVLCIDVYYNEGGTAGWSYDINNSGTWVSGGGTGILSNTIHRWRITSGSPITDFRIRAAASGGTALTSRITGVDCWNTAPVGGVTQGLRMTNLGKDSDFLGVFDRTNASGDNFALFDGDPGSLQPDLALLGPFTNDVLTGSGAYAAYGTHLANLVNRFKPYCDVILVGYSEQGGARAPSDQQTLRNWVHSTAQSLGVAYLDMYDAMVGQGITGWAAADAEGYHGTIHDVNHYGPLGHQEMTARFDRMLTSF